MEILNPTVSADLDAGKLLKFDLGGGMNKKDGYYGLDHLALDGVDVLADLNKPLELLPDNCVESIYSSHVLEHIRELDSLLREIRRITIPDGEIEICVPHFSNPYYYSDPTHIRFFGLYSMYYYVDQIEQPKIRKVPAFYSDIRFHIKKINIEFFRLGRLDRLIAPLLSRLVNRNIKSQNFYERRLSGLISARQIRFIMSPKK